MFTLCKIAGTKLSASSRISNDIIFQKKRILLKAFAEWQFGYFPLAWRFDSKKANSKLNHIHERILKSGSHLPRKICIICFIESSLKLIKNAFYFIVKALFFLKIFKFLSCFSWSCRRNNLIRKVRLTSKFMTSQPG